MKLLRIIAVSGWEIYAEEKEIWRGHGLDLYKVFSITKLTGDRWQIDYSSGNTFKCDSRLILYPNGIKQIEFEL